MCRESLPVWQQFFDRHRASGIAVVGVSVGVEGATRAAPFVEDAGAKFDVLLDETFLLGDVFGFATLRNVALVDERGVVQWLQAGGFDLRDTEAQELIEAWAGDPSSLPSSSTPIESGATVVRALREGSAAWHAGDRDGARAAWRAALQADPDNPLLRDQVWSVEHPDRYFSGPVDKEWQSDRTGSQEGEGGVIPPAPSPRG